MDLEMTGLDHTSEVIVEIATIVTDDELEVVAEGPDAARIVAATVGAVDHMVELQPHRGSTTGGLAAAAVAPWALGLTGPVYGACAAVLSLVFLVLAARVAANRATEPSAMDSEKHLFAYSVFYLFALFTVLVADGYLPW